MHSQKTKLPFKIKASNQRLIKEVAQDYASKKWKNDTNNELRLSDMCELVWADMYTDIEASLKHFSNAPESLATAQAVQALFPDQPSGLKKHLREVAPAYASKKGAPRKKKNK